MTCVGKPSCSSARLTGRFVFPSNVMVSAGQEAGSCVPWPRHRSAVMFRFLCWSREDVDVDIPHAPCGKAGDASAKKLLVFTGVFRYGVTCSTWVDFG